MRCHGDGVGAFMRDWRELQGGSEGEDFLLFSLKWGRSCSDCFGMGRTIIIKSVAVTAFAATALGNAVALEQSNTVTWYDALHAFSMLTGSLVAIAIPFVELPE